MPGKRCRKGRGRKASPCSVANLITSRNYFAIGVRKSPPVISFGNPRLSRFSSVGEISRSDPSVRAIVLRIDSPGGSAIASDAIWRELVITRDERHDRPLVVSMSDLAASGGYWMAMAAPYIVAQPGTLTGSIGVITGKMVTGGLYTKLGANIETVSQGKFAELASPVRPFNDAERKKVESMAGIRAHARGCSSFCTTTLPSTAGWWATWRCSS